MRFTLLLTLFSLLASAGWAQEKSQSGTPRFRASVDQVVVYASVYDQEGRLVSGLKKSDFRIFEDRVEQEITGFAQAEVPSTIGIVLDTSGSMRDKMPMVEQAIDLFLSLNNEQNELFFIRFDDEVELEEDFTKEVADIQDAVNNVLVKGGTALYDAIYLSVDKAEQGGEPKKVIVVFTDGEDKDSYYTSDEVLEKVQESETQLFIVSFLDEDLSDDRGFFGIFKSDKEKVTTTIEDMADVTGGRAFFPEQIGALNGIFEQIARELKNQYRISYISSNNTRDGAWRRIDVKVEEADEKDLKVRARKGYYAQKDS